ncbi:MAG: GNAT family N-acetyltransferase [Rudaea sp.]|nr:GNAT family N-acetyltransferase [Rudaea sp.]
MDRVEKLHIELRAIDEGDAAFLYAVYASTRAEELAPLGWNDAQRESFLRMQFEAQRRDYWSNCDTARFRIIVCDGEPAGRLYVERRADELCIVDIALLPAFRNRGIGSVLIGRLFAEADAAALAVRIHVEHNNPAQRLYARLGFEFCGEAGAIHRLMERRPLLQQSVA